MYPHIFGGQKSRAPSLYMDRLASSGIARTLGYSPLVSHATASRVAAAVGAQVSDRELGSGPRSCSAPPQRDHGRLEPRAMRETQRVRSG